MASVKMEEIKEEAMDQLQDFNDSQLRMWTEPEDVKVNFKKDCMDKIVKAMEEEGKGHSGHSGDEVEDSPAPTTTARLQNHNTTNMKSHQVKALVKELCQEAPVSEEISNMCDFICFDCNIVFNGWRSIVIHDSRVHGQKLSRTKVSERISRAFSHKCRICSVKIICDLDFIKTHVMKHGMGAKQYMEDFGNRPKRIYSKDIIGNLCVYQCNDCNQEFKIPRHLNSHQRALSHGHYSHNYSRKSNKSLVKSVYHECKLCNASLLCAMSALHCHFKRRHFISIEEYCKKTGCTMRRTKVNKPLLSGIKSLKVSANMDNMCVFKCDICTKTYCTLKPFKNHMNREHKTRVHMYANKDYVNPLSKYIVKGKSYRCEYCSILMLCELGTIHEHMRQHHGLTGKDESSVPSTKKMQYSFLRDSFLKNTPVSHLNWKRTIVPISEIPLKDRTSTIGNLCTFSCPKCDDEDFPSWCALIQHCSNAHNMNNVCYNPTLVSVARSHACLICPKAILSDRTFLQWHLRGHHKIGLPEYERIYVQNGGESLPTYVNWRRKIMAKTV